MSAAACQQAIEGVGVGIGASLRGVDCAASAMAQAAFNRLSSPDGALGPALSIMLTLWIAFLGFGLVTGRLRIGLAALTPRMVSLVLVITFATSWVAFQSVFWNLAVGAPDQIATLLMGTGGSATTIFADKLDAVMLALMDASGGTDAANATSLFSPPGLLWTGGTLLLLGTVGVLATCKIALAILMGLGPIFIVLALFDATRGLFAGWLKGVVLLALAPLFAVFGGSLMLELAVPVLAALAATPGQIDVRAAMAFFMIGAVHLALMAMVLKVATTIVAGWQVFGLARSPAAEGAARAAAAAPPPPAAARPASLALPAPRAPAFGPASAMTASGAAMPVPANDASAPAIALRELRLAAPVAGAAPSPSAPGGGGARARGVGSRFRAAPPRHGDKPR